MHSSNITTIAYPNVPFTPRGIIGKPWASAVFTYTVLPHHVATESAPIVPEVRAVRPKATVMANTRNNQSPLRGYCRMKKMRMAETATPLSMAADKTSTRSIVSV